MRLLFFIHSLSSGGAERVATSLANHWAAKGWDITIVTLTSPDLDFYELHPKIRRVSLYMAHHSGNVLTGLWQNLRRVQALRRALRQAQPDIAVAVMSAAIVLLALAAWSGAKVCAIGSEQVHPPEWPLGAQWEALRRLSYGRLAAVVAQTQKSADWLTAHTSARRVPIIPSMVLWPLPIRTPRIDPDATRSPGRCLLLAVGRLDKQKGFDWLLDVFAALAPQHERWDLAILGEGEERGALQSRAQAAELNGRVSFPGRAGNVGEWYARADLYVMSSRFEGFPNTLVEAMAYGLPAVSFDCDTGPRDIIRPEVDGLLVPPGDTQGLQTALDRLMRDADLRARFSARAVEARERFSSERVAGMWEALFAEVRR